MYVCMEAQRTTYVDAQKTHTCKHRYNLQTCPNQRRFLFALCKQFQKPRSSLGIGSQHVTRTRHTHIHMHTHMPTDVRTTNQRHAPISQLHTPLTPPLTQTTLNQKTYRQTDSFTCDRKQCNCAHEQTTSSNNTTPDTHGIHSIHKRTRAQLAQTQASIPLLYLMKTGRKEENSKPQSRRTQISTTMSAFAKVAPRQVKAQSFDEYGNEVAFDVREDAEQDVMKDKTIQLLLAAGYFRARISRLSLFDKVL